MIINTMGLNILMIFINLANKYLMNVVHNFLCLTKAAAYRCQSRCLCLGITADSYHNTTTITYEAAQGLEKISSFISKQGPLLSYRSSPTAGMLKGAQ